MGNIISTADGELDTSTDLGRFIKDYALNEIAIDARQVSNPTEYLDVNKRTLLPISKNLLKKRACCTGQTKIPISLPAIDPVTKKLESVTILIPVFDKESDINDANCTLPYRNNENRNYKFTNNSTMFVESNSDACAELYEQQLCPAVRNIRNKNFKDRNSKLYGQYPDKVTGNFKTNNAFVDCNCENSFYKNLTPTEQAAIKSNIPMVSPDTMAQTLDIRCNSFPQITWKRGDVRAKNLCVNTVVAGAISASDQANLGIKQSCSTSSTETTNDGKTQSQTPANTATVNTKSSNIPDKVLSQTGTPMTQTTTTAPLAPIPKSTTPEPLPILTPVPKTTPIPDVKTTSTPKEEGQIENIILYFKSNPMIALGSVIVILVILYFLSKNKGSNQELPPMQYAPQMQYVPPPMQYAPPIQPM